MTDPARIAQLEGEVARLQDMLDDRLECTCDDDDGNCVLYRIAEHKEKVKAERDTLHAELAASKNALGSALIRLQQLGEKEIDFTLYPTEHIRLLDELGKLKACVKELEEEIKSGQHLKNIAAFMEECQKDIDSAAEIRANKAEAHTTALRGALRNYREVVARELALDSGLSRRRFGTQEIIAALDKADFAQAALRQGEGRSDGQVA